jgi:elongation factor P hydroxylase
MSNVIISHQNAVAEFEARLNQFDWWYKYNDTYEYWVSAEKLHGELKKIADSHPDFQEVYLRVKSEKGPE